MEKSTVLIVGYRIEISDPRLERVEKTHWQLEDYREDILDLVVGEGVSYFLGKIIAKSDIYDIEEREIGIPVSISEITNIVFLLEEQYDLQVTRSEIKYYLVDLWDR